MRRIKSGSNSSSVWGSGVRRRAAVRGGCERGEFDGRCDGSVPLRERARIQRGIAHLLRIRSALAWRRWRWSVARIRESHAIDCSLRAITIGAGETQLLICSRQDRLGRDVARSAAAATHYDASLQLTPNLGSLQYSQKASSELSVLLQRVEQSIAEERGDC